MRARLAPVFAEIDGSGWQDLLADLVRTPSHPHLERQEEAVAGVLADYLVAAGIPAIRREVRPGRPNLLATVKGPAPGRRLVLCGHTDTVPLNAGSPGAGFLARIENGSLHGRGAADMKGALAAMAAALVALARSGALAGGELVLAAVIDEEMESLGAEALVTDGFRADGAIIGEPTNNRLARGHKGLEWLEIRFTGKSAHGGTAGAGVNAILGASRFVERVYADLIPLLEQRAHALLGPPTINVGTIRGGDQPSTVAGSCTVAVDRRSVPGESYESLTGELRVLLEAIESSMPGLRTEIARMPGGMANLEHLPLVTPEDDPLVGAVRVACESVKGSPEPGESFPAWSDGALLSNFAGIPCVVLGPGDLAVAHSPHEHVPLAQVAEAARLYAASALAFCPAGV